MNVRRACMRDQIRELLVERILDGSYPPGTRLKELALAAECNVSQAPIREALRELEALGLVESERYRGTRVRAADIEQLREAYELRALLEERAAQLAVPCAENVLRELRKSVDCMRSALRRRDWKVHADAAAGFHRTIVAASGNATFLRAWDSLHWEVRTRVAGQQMRERGVDVRSFLEAHAQVAEVLATGDGFAAGRQLREIAERVLALIETPLPRQPARAGRFAASSGSGAALIDAPLTKPA